MKTQKRFAAQNPKVTQKWIKFDESKLDEIKEAITKADLRVLINEGTVAKIPVRGTSRFHARFIHNQKKKGRRKGHGSRKGKATARTETKRMWINKVRLQRELLKQLRADQKLENAAYYDLYNKSKGGFFRSIRHMKIYIQERNILKK